MCDTFEVMKAEPWVGLKDIEASSCDLAIMDLCGAMDASIGDHAAGIAMGLAHAISTAGRVAIVWDPATRGMDALSRSLEGYCRAFTEYGFMSVCGCSPLAVRIGSLGCSGGHAVMDGMARHGGDHERVLRWLIRSYTLAGQRVLLPWVSSPGQAGCVLTLNRRLAAIEPDARAFRSLLINMDQARSVAAVRGF